MSKLAVANATFELDTSLQNAVIKYLTDCGFVGKIHKSKSSDQYILGVLVPLETCLEQIAYQFPQLRTQVQVKIWNKQVPYFECSLRKNYLKEIFERHNIYVFKDIDNFNKTKKEFDQQAASFKTSEIETIFRSNVFS